MHEDEPNQNYLLVTPAKNEERNLTAMAQSVVNQTMTPRLWVIMDDGSSDGTAEVIHGLTRRHSWIVGASLSEHPRDVYFHYAEVCMKGFDLAISYLRENKINCEFLGLVDADTWLEPTYFERLMDEFRKDVRLGLASGGLFHEKNGRFALEGGDMGSPRGTGRLWRKSCFFETGGYIACQAPPDTISNAKAKIRGYHIKQIPTIMAVQFRATSGAEGIWAGYKSRGRSWHYINAHPVLVLINVLYFSGERPRYRGAAFLLGYSIAFVRRDKKIGDEEILRYFWKQRARELIANAKGR